MVFLLIKIGSVEPAYSTARLNDVLDVFRSVIGVVLSEDSKRGDHRSGTFRSGHSYSIMIDMHDPPYSISDSDRTTVMDRNELTKDFGGVQPLKPLGTPELAHSSIAFLQRQQGVNRIKQAVVRNERSV
jgi:hypothetical protein